MKILTVWKTRAEIDIGNTIENDVKSYQVKTTIVKFTKVLIKAVKLTDHIKNIGMDNEYMTK